MPGPQDVLSSCTVLERQHLVEGGGSSLEGSREICVFVPVSQLLLLLGVQRKRSFEMMNTNIGLMAQMTTKIRAFMDPVCVFVDVCASNLILLQTLHSNLTSAVACQSWGSLPSNLLQ